MEFTSLFLNNLWEVFCYPFTTLGTTNFSQSTVGSSTCTSVTGSVYSAAGELDDGDVSGCLTTAATATSTAIAYLYSLDEAEVFEEVELTKAYVESLSEEELSSLIDSLDKLEVQLTSSDDNTLKRV